MGTDMTNGPFFSLSEAAEQLQAPLSRLRRELHEHPELSEGERETTKRLRALFAGPPFELLPLDVPTGLAVRIRGNGPGRRVAIRADMDALPVQEWADHPVCSQTPGVMHACGHDMHMTFAYGAGLLLAQAREHFAGEVLLLFQPAEENAVGARQMIEAGLLDRYPLDAIIGGHVKPELPAGQLSIRDGAVMAAIDGFRIRIIGRGGHGATPQDCRDPIVAAASLIQALQTLVSRTSDPRQACVLSVCSIHGGSTDNVTPDEVILSGTLRTVDPRQRARCRERFYSIAQNTVRAMECEIEITERRGAPVVMNDPGATRICRARAQALLGPAQVTALPVDTIAEDFSLFAERVPGCFIGVGTAEPDQPFYPLHSQRFFPDDRLLPLGAAVYAEMAMGLLDRRNAL